MNDELPLPELDDRELLAASAVLDATSEAPAGSPGGTTADAGVAEDVRPAAGTARCCG